MEWYVHVYVYPSTYVSKVMNRSYIALTYSAARLDCKLENGSVYTRSENEALRSSLNASRRSFPGEFHEFSRQFFGFI